MTEDSIFVPVQTKEKLVDRVAAQLTDLIISGKLAAGTKLPPETQLGERYGVSRTVVREAIQMLNAQGLAQTRHGYGTLVCDDLNQRVSQSLTVAVTVPGLSLEQAHEVRALIEITLAAHAAESGDEQGKSALTAIVERMEAAGDDPLIYAETETAFHAQLAAMSSNPLLRMLHSALAARAQDVRQAIARRPAIALSGLSDHRRILEAILAGDADSARQTMNDHMDRMRRIQKTVEK